ncbi:Multidrug resistance-like ATP-binding protein mdlB [Klebsiella pneumoniae ISC21]|nr:Multidrug resistance-like ATP-binding protein mdlB [Klebsiella pneumoniae ISC21]
MEADTILVLHRGQAVERGTHQQLLAAKGRYWQMYQLQLAGEELRPAPERSRSAPDAPPAGRERWAACDGAKTLHQMHRCGAFFARQAPLRRILPDLSPVFCHQRAALRPFFHFWHSPCFISIVLAAAITEY